MWWALAASAIPYVMQAFNGQPDAPGAPPRYVPPDRSAYNSQLLNNAFNPRAEIFQRASDTVNENVNRSLARSGMGGSSVGAALSANTEGVLAQKWLEDQTSRQRMALNEVNTDDLSRAHALNESANEQYQYGSAAYNRNNAWNASQVQGAAGMPGGFANAYGQQQTNNRLDANSAAYIDAMNRMKNYYSQGSAPVGYGYQAPSNDLYSNYSAPANYGPSISPTGY